MFLIDSAVTVPISLFYTSPVFKLPAPVMTFVTAVNLTEN